MHNLHKLLNDNKKTQRKITRNQQKWNNGTISQKKNKQKIHG